MTKPVFRLRIFPYLIVCILLFNGCSKETPADTGLPASVRLNEKYGTEPLQNMDVYLPANRNSTDTKVLILIHGGAWASGDKADFGSFIDTLKKRLPDYALFNINYRLSAPPQNPFPTQELDVKKAVEYIYNNRNAYGVSDNFSLGGASAGAHLSLLQAFKYTSPVKIRTVIDFFGPTDMNDLYNNPGVIPQATIAAIVGATPASNPDLYNQSSPIRFVTGTNACPTIILQGSDDLLVNATSQSKALRDRLLINGTPVQYVEYAGKGHGEDWDNATYTDAFSRIQAFLEFYNP